MAIKFLSGQTISGTLTVSGNIQAPTFNGLAINTTGTNNVANQIVRTQANGYANFGWINSVSGNHTGSITRITASNDAYLRYVTPAQFRTGVTDGFYAPASTVSGVTSVATGNGLTGGTIVSTGTLSMSGSYSGDFTIGGTSGSTGNALAVNRGSDGSQAMRIQNSGEVVIPSNYLYCNAGGTSLYVQNSAVFRGAILNDTSGAPVTIGDDLTIDGGNVILGGTGRIQGVDTVSASTDAANKAYVDAHPGSGGTVTSVATGNGLTGGTITSSGTLTMSGDYTGSLSITDAYLAGKSFSDPDIVLSVTDEDTTASVRNKITGSTAITKVSDATAPAPGCFQVNGSFYPQGFGPYYKISEGDEFIFELWIRYVSGSATYNLLYAGSNFYNAAGTYLGNSQRYWGESSLNINANTGTGWYHVSGTLGPNRGSGTGDIPTTAESMRLLFLFNYAPNGTIVTNYCGLKVYKSNPTVTKLYRKTLGSEGGTSRNRDLVVDSNGDIHTSSVIAPVGMTLKVDTGNVSALTIDNVGSTTFSGYTYFPNYLFHAGDTNTRIEFTTGTVTLRGDTSILLDGPVTANSSMTVASTFTTSGQITANGNIYLKDRISLPASGLSSVTGSPAYAIFQEGGAWTHPYPDLHIAMHTGIKFGANASYNGMRFYDDYTMATQVMSVNNSSDGLGGGNVFVNNSLQAGSSLRAPIFYDSNATNYYVEPRGTSLTNNQRILDLAVGTNGVLALKGTIGIHSSASPYISFHDGTLSRTAYFQEAGGRFYCGEINYTESEGSFRAPVFYDSNNAAFYGDFASTSTSLSTAGKWVCQGGHGSARMQLNYQHSSTDSANSGTLTGWVSEPGITYNGAGIGGNINVSGQYYGRAYNSGYGCYVRFDKSNGNVEHWTTTGNSGTTGGQGTRRWYNDNAGNAFASLSSRAPIFYDSNNTGYYVDPASTSQLNVLNCAGTLTVTGAGGVVAPKFTDYNNGSFYLDPSSTGTSLNVAGDVVAYASSDIRFKNNITPITNALDKLSKIGGYTFEWNEISHKETGKKDIGVVAQEVEEILPEIVQTRSNGYKAVDYQKLTALLIESVKEQQVIINDLKTRIETLENN